MKPKTKSTQSTQPVSQPDASEISAQPKHLRLLRWDETAVRGDFIADGQKGFEPWQGPAGFQAGSFVKLIYREQKNPPTKV